MVFDLLLLLFCCNLTRTVAVVIFISRALFLHLYERANRAPSADLCIGLALALRCLLLYTTFDFILTFNLLKDLGVKTS